MIITKEIWRRRIKRSRDRYNRYQKRKREKRCGGREADGVMVRELGRYSFAPAVEYGL